MFSVLGNNFSKLDFDFFFTSCESSGKIRKKKLLSFIFSEKIKLSSAAVVVITLRGESSDVSYVPYQSHTSLCLKHTWNTTGDVLWENHFKPRPGFKVITLFSCSTQLSIKFVLVINLKLITTANSFLLNVAEHENFSTNMYENSNYVEHEKVL